MGWKHEETVKELEAKRKVKSAEYYKDKCAKAAARAAAAAKVDAAWA